ncbi:hypothetical protein PGUG_05555 [Meyerozyma guilliermondii ATCC 6260]|uniref:GPI-anchored protein n=1 Tax=Meyerozyma guilliermondii (strain ATCC 6260 / CBS 566 / DSM 6381 / JCM 1539 / NBRC 10279 / NRRL Y-324) TaxID=294746 RepID=A5DQK4_PICGU|nr:uncharacterized protein PGUG_05555 [Meyerozyma guilliermondii ATCC 6260]EDK41457.2 hypothetical protein PGUG_05555 [Meyerozyma guilliermondii ATCC 6260]
MKTLSFFFLWVFAAVAMALPRAMPVPDTSFDLQEMMEDFFDQANVPELDQFYSMANLYKRDEKTIETLLEYVNKSGIIFDLLDQIADYPERVQAIGNLTVGLLGRLPPIDLSNLSLPKNMGSMTNNSLVNVLLKSGLVKSLADGLLLDESFRPVLVNLTYRIVDANKNVILYIVDGVLAKRDLKKRADDYSGSLGEFAKNIFGSVLDSKLFLNTFGDIVNALNDTGVAVYVVKKFLSDDAYLNMTATIANDAIHSGAINITGTPNITKIIGGVLADPSALGKLASGALSGKVDLKGIFGKYSPAIKGIIQGLERKGLFEELNDYIFPSSSSQTPQTTSNKKEAQATLSVTTTGVKKDKASSSAKGAGSTTTHNNSLMRALFYIQSFIFGGALILF